MTLAPRIGATPRFNETTTAVVGAFVVALVLSTIFINPLRAMIHAYSDYSQGPAGAGTPMGTAPAAPTAPAK